jgi:steroid 5-alpha reductase family enzyme
MLNIHYLLLIVLLMVATVLWLQQLRTQNAGWVDVFWAWSVGIVGMSFLLTGSGALLPRVIAGSLLLVWSLRLGGHIFQRVSQETSEDGRYAAMREALGGKAQPVFLFFYWGQALLAWCFALTFWVVAEQDFFTTPLVLLGGGMGLFAIALESLADKQLARFKKRPDSKGKTCREGLWRYSRHPNYFGEWLHWVSYPVIATGALHGEWLWLLPLAMFVFLWFVTGIPYTEKQALKSRGDNYRDYQRTTSAFFPWRPKS